MTTPNRAPVPGPGLFKRRPPVAQGPATPAAQTAPAVKAPTRPQPQPLTSANLPGHDFFVNPYNFVPLHTRREAQDGPPPTQGVWHGDRYSGDIALGLTTVTPLLAVRRARVATRTEPALLTVRTAPDGTPAVNGSSIKGMLRVLFEQATGSRLGVFGQDETLSYRRSAESARGLSFAKVVVANDDALTLSITRGVRAVGWHRSGEPVWARVDSVRGIPFGHEVYMWIELLYKDQRRAWFPQTVGLSEAEADVESNVVGPEGWEPADAPQLFVRAQVHNTGQTIQGKRFERVFVEEILRADPEHTDTGNLLDAKPATVRGKDWRHLRATWEAQIDSMSGEAGTDSAGEKLDLAPYANRETRKAWRKLAPGQTLFLRRDLNGKVTHLYPGMITRDIRPHTAAELLPHAFRPAVSEDELSPADRVFGWVAGTSTKGRPAYRGLLAVGGVRCVTDDPIERFPAVRLATLGSPKSTQFRFYTRARPTCPAAQPAPLGSSLSVEDAFNPAKHVIAGHKVYPHHGVPEEWWTAPKEPWQPGDDADPGPAHPVGPTGEPLNWLAPNGTKKQVSTDLDSWVRPGVTFETRLRVTNLSASDLGALIWVLQLGGSHRLGMGKPLGFGSLSVTIDWTRTALRTTDQMVERYRSVSEGTVLSEEEVKRLTDRFDEGFRTSQPAVYLAMQAASSGFSGQTPVHYPRVRPGQPQTENFHWFVTNERGVTDTDVHGPRHALPTLTDDADPRLPLLGRRGT